MADQAEQKDKKSEVALREEKTLAFWQAQKIFEKSLEQTRGKEEYVFYDGPPFATGLPHYGHILAGTIKDAVPRYQTMRGKHVARRWGWDCHGLPAENIVEKKLGLETKKDILDYGIGNFNEQARQLVLEYVLDWKKIVPRLGRFVDMDNDYRTMDSSYTESVLAVFKRLYEKGFVYEGYKAMQICPRCETTLSNFEVNQGYKDVTDLSVYVKFELVDEPGTFVVAWTTTPWTLPGNVALAVNPQIDYVKLKRDNQCYFLAETRLEKYQQAGDEIVSKITGQALVGKSYKPIFDYYANDTSLKNNERGWKIYGADFVTTDSGTGIVHIAPAFGEDDMKLGQEQNLPFIQHVGMNGHFKPEVALWPDEPVKPKDDPQATDLKVLKYLAATGLLFGKEKIVHSYPHCWRCQTPLLNYAASSWFVEVTKFKDQLVENNRQITWVPEHIKDGRFGKWLEGARDWAISRSRFWGAPIPVWKCADCPEIKVIGSVSDLKTSKQTGANHYFLMRHGESESNLNDTISCKFDTPTHLTEKGKDQSRQSATALIDKKIDLIISSDFVRTKETASIVAATLGIASEQIIFDQRLREIDLGELDGSTWSAFISQFKSRRDRFDYRQHGGESCEDLKKRVGALLYELAEKYQHKNILIVSHGQPLYYLTAVAQGLSNDELCRQDNWGTRFTNAEVKEISFVLLPHNDSYSLDFHRPYIDAVVFPCVCGGKMKRVLDVFDCWFESGSMPYGEAHYPFELEKFNPERGIGFPADFIAEGLDQTRGWFYSMLVLSTALFGQTSYRNVIVNGIVLAEDGQKMSKSLQNYPDPLVMVNKFGADALRFYLLSSPLMRGEDLNFSEKGLGDVYRKITMRLVNVVSFYSLYAPATEIVDTSVSTNILDRWVLTRFDQLVTEVTVAMEAYTLDRATRPIDEFIDDLSNWYVRRSRERFKSDDAVDRQAAMATTRKILHNLSLVIAPFMPFMAEEIYQQVKVADEPESVHLANWPTANSVDQSLLTGMSLVRAFSTVALMERSKNQINVRQPLSKLSVFHDGPVPEYWSELQKILADEINVKEIVLVKNAGPDQASVWFDLTLTAELKEEGSIRELIRQIQDERKKAELAPVDQIKLFLTSNLVGGELARRFTEEIKQKTNTLELLIEETKNEENETEPLYTLRLEKIA